MIRFEPPQEPDGFDADVRNHGNYLLRLFFQEHNRFPQGKEWKNRSFWTDYIEDLEDGFRGLCAYSGLRTNFDGEVDHFVPKSEDAQLAYEWSNYRYTTARRNRKKNGYHGPVLDPFQVHDEWFEVIPESGQLRITEHLPANLIDVAKETIRVLGLDDQRMRKNRRAIARNALKPENYYNVALLDDIRERAPMVARAVQVYWDQVS